MRQEPFTAERREGPVGKTKIYDRSTGRPILRKTVRVDGQDYEEEVLAPDFNAEFTNWIGDIEESPGRMNGFGAFLQDQGVTPESWVAQPEGFAVQEENYPDIRVQAFSKGMTPLEQARLGHRVSRDSTGVPDNFSMIDRDPENRTFFGRDKPDELQQVRERMQTTDRKVERPDYDEGQRPRKSSFKARPIKWLVKE